MAAVKRFLELALIIIFALTTTGAVAHTLPCFTWFKVDRQIVATPGELRVTHVCHFNPLGFRPGDPLLDTDDDSTASLHEIAAACALTARYLAQDFLVLISEQPVPASLESFSMLEGGDGFRTEILVPLPETGNRIPVCLMDPAFLFPPVAGSSDDASTSSGLIRACDSGVVLLDPSGQAVSSLPLLPTFRTDFTVERPGTEVRP